MENSRQKLTYTIKRVRPIKKMLHSRDHSPHERYSTSPRSHSTSPQPIGNSSTVEQWSDNGGIDSETNETKLARPWFRKPPWSKAGSEHINEDRKKRKIRWIGDVLILFHPFALLIYSILAFASGEKRNINNNCVYVGLIVIACIHFLRYSDNFELLLSSIFQLGEKGRLGYFGDPVLTEFGLNGLQIAGLVYQFIEFRPHIAIFVFGILSVITRPIGNVMLIVEKGKKEQNLAANESAQASNSHDPIELQSYNQTTE